MPRNEKELPTETDTELWYNNIVPTTMNLQFHRNIMQKSLKISFSTIQKFPQLTQVIEYSYLGGLSSRLPWLPRCRSPNNRPFSSTESRLVRSKCVWRARRVSPRILPKPRRSPLEPSTETLSSSETLDRRSIDSNGPPPTWRFNVTSV